MSDRSQKQLISGKSNIFQYNPRINNFEIFQNVPEFVLMVKQSINIYTTLHVNTNDSYSEYVIFSLEVVISLSTDIREY